MALDKDVRDGVHHDRAVTPADAKAAANAAWDDDDEDLTPEAYAAWEAECVEECQRRIADLEAGRTTTVALEEVKARLLARLG